MSMSALQAQLAALNGATGKHAGSIVATSRRQEDALGRGLHFRPSHGHAVTETIRFKASFVYPSAEEAAKVPLRTIQDNAQEAARNLSSFEPSIAHDLSLLFGSSEAPVETIRSVLIHISTLLGEKNDSIVGYCLQILEYLLRRYKVHLSADTWQDLIWCFLPHHAQRATLLHRCLQMIDLASTANQSYLFLRQYADPKNAISIPRSLISQQVMKNTNLLRNVCAMVQEATAWVDVESVDDDGDEVMGESKDIRYGLGFFFSWTAACVVEGLAWQRKSPSISDMEREAILRVLVPSVRHACASTHDARSWGYIVGSAAAETMELGDAVLTVWTSAILEYSSDQLQAWAAILSILVPPQTASTYVNEDCYLPLINEKWLGCPLPQETFLIATQDLEVAQILGVLHEELLVAPLLAAFLVRSIKNKNTIMVLSLLQESSLESLWKQDGLDLIASASSWVASTTAANFKTEASDMSLVLKELHRMDPDAAEEGFAHALYHIQQLAGEGTGGPSQTTRLVRILEGIVSAPLQEHQGEIALPPRVALDHADSKIRLDAIAKLVALVQKESVEDGDKHPAGNLLRSLIDTFVRRWGQDQDFQVAKALGKALSQLLPMVANQDALHLDTQAMLAGFHRWAQTKEDDLTFVSSALEMLKTALVCGTWDDGAKEKLLALEVCVANVSHSNEHVAKTAKTAIIEMSTFMSDEKLGFDDLVHAMLRVDPFFLKTVCSGLIKGSPELEASTASELAIREQCAYSLLSLWSDTKEHSSEIARYCLNLSGAFLVLSPRRMLVSPEKEAKVIKCLENCAETLSAPDHIVFTVATLASITGDCYKTVSIPVLRTLLANTKDDQDRQLSPVATLFECCLTDQFSVDVVCRLVGLASDYASKDKSPVASFSGIIPALSLLEHNDDRIRHAASAFLSRIGETYGSGSTKDWSDCEDLAGLEPVYNDVFKTFAADNSFQSLTGIVSECVKGKKGHNSRKSFLRLCLLTARGTKASDPIAKLLPLPPPSKSMGTLDAVSVILKALELAGEEDFPLVDRWKFVGQRLTEVIRNLSEPHEVKSFSCLQTSVVKMLKGRYLANPKTVITSGPRAGGSGGRTRSYSLGNSDDVRTIESYPAQMSEAILSVLNSKAPGGMELASTIVTDLFLDSIWVDQVLSKFDEATRVQILAALVELVDEDYSDVVAASIGQLPFDGADVHGLLCRLMKDKVFNLSSIVSVARFVTSNAETIGGSVNGTRLIEKLFDVLAGLSTSAKDYDSSDFEYACESIVNALDVLCRNTSLPSRPSGAIIQGFKLMLLFQGVKSHHIFTAKKYRLSALSLTATLADRYPSEGLSALLDCFKAAIGSSVLNALGQKHRIELMSRVLVVFWKNPSHIPFIKILGVLSVDLPMDNTDTNENLFSDVVLSLSKSSKVEETSEQNMCTPGALAAVTVALESKVGNGAVPPKALQAIRSAPRKSKMPSLVLIFQYARNIVVELSDESGLVEQVPSPLPSHKEITKMISSPSKAEEDSSSIMDFILTMTRLLHECLQMSDVQRMISKGTGEEAKCCLALWQGALWLHVVAQSLQSTARKENDLWQKLSKQLGEIRDELQLIMPMTLFLASVSSLLEADSRSETLSHALALVAERVSEIHSSSPEAALFFGLVPDLCQIMTDDSWSREKTDSDQSALMAIEHIGGVLLVGEEAASSNSALVAPFVTAVERIATMLDKGLLDLKLGAVSFRDVQASHRDLICSLALTAATLVRIIGVRSLPYLPKIMKPLVASLSMANEEVSLCGKQSKTVEPRDMQLATVRAISAIADAVPQFLGPNLRSIMLDSVLLSKSLRTSNERILHQAIANLDSTISVKLPARLFIPAVGRIIESTNSVDNLLILMPMLQLAVKNLSSREAGALKSSLFACVTRALDFDGASETKVVGQASGVLVSFVLKLSEGQLRRVYTALKDWKNEFHATPNASNATRREAFWAISAALADQLRSLFLPCVTTVVDDLVMELEHAVSMICTASSEKGAGGRKKRKLIVNEEPPYLGCTRVLRQVLAVLESSLRADGREGGNWIRTEEGKRYNLILEPLAKLFQCTPSVNTEGDHIRAYKDLVEGTEDADDGNVVACLTALAVAAGDEQLWKPLNHAVLEAAGTDGRSEVRHAGLVCLLSLMKTLGEEYMVLLPECLPVLSELLEDSNEEVGGLARDIITLAEELIGDSLEETLG